MNRGFKDTIEGIIVDSSTEQLEEALELLSESKKEDFTRYLESLVERELRERDWVRSPI